MKSHKWAGQVQRIFKEKRVKTKLALIIEKVASFSKITCFNGYGVLEVT